jgi:hypothetical protein
MKGYLTIPKSIYCKPCKQCGARPVIALTGPDGYVIKCPTDDGHYQTKSGLIDVEDWNIHNTVLYDNE